MPESISRERYVDCMMEGKMNEAVHALTDCEADRSLESLIRLCLAMQTFTNSLATAMKRHPHQYERKGAKPLQAARRIREYVAGLPEESHPEVRDARDLCVAKIQLWCMEIIETVIATQR